MLKTSQLSGFVKFRTYTSPTEVDQDSVRKSHIDDMVFRGETILKYIATLSPELKTLYAEGVIRFSFTNFHGNRDEDTILSFIRIVFTKNAFLPDMRFKYTETQKFVGYAVGGRKAENYVDGKWIHGFNMIPCVVHTCTTHSEDYAVRFSCGTIVYEYTSTYDLPYTFELEKFKAFRETVSRYM